MPANTFFVARVIGTNADNTYPLEDGPPQNVTLTCSQSKMRRGEAVDHGQAGRFMYEERCGGGIKKENAVMVGDRWTPISRRNRLGYEVCWCWSGATSQQDVAAAKEKSDHVGVPTWLPAEM